MGQEKVTLIIGASENQNRYSYKAADRLTKAGHSIELMSIKKGTLFGKDFLKPLETLKNIDTVTLYLNPTLQEDYYDYIIKLNPRRVIFNPGTENQDFKSRLKDVNIEVVENCTLVMLSLDIY